MRGCEDEKMFYRPPLLEEPCAQTLSGTTNYDLSIQSRSTLKKVRPQTILGEIKLCNVTDLSALFQVGFSQQHQLSLETSNSTEHALRGEKA